MSVVSPGTHVLDQAIALTAVDGPAGRSIGATHPAWGNMVGPFGGITAATALNAVLQHPQLLGAPISLTVNFCSAVAPGPFDIQAVPVRTNRSTQHWTVTLTQPEADGQPGTVLTATAVTAARRETFSINEIQMPPVPAPEAVQRMQVTGVEWINRYDMRPVFGAPPEIWDGSGDDGGDGSLTQVWVRDEPERPLDFPALMALSDVFYPRVWRRRAKRVPAGTVSITTYLHADAAMLARTGTGYLLGQARAQSFRNGFYDQTVQLWNAAGELLATSHQITYYKE